MKRTMILLCILVLTSCKYSSTFTNLKELDESREKVSVVASGELTPENQLALREYFSKVKDLSYEFKTNTKMQKYIHKYFSKYYNASLCDNLLVAEKVYSQILKKCNVSGFYICSEEVRSYKDILLALKKELSEEEMKMITSEASCNRKLVDLGVVVEQ